MVTIMKRLHKIILPLVLVISCNQKKKEITPELKPEKDKSEMVTQEERMKVKIDSIYEIYKKGKVEKYDWDFAFQRGENYQKVSKSYSDKKKVPIDFLEFSNKFTSDPNFQKKHIDFENLVAVVGTCDETYVLKENNWVYIDWDFLEEIGIDEEWSNTFSFSENTFYVEYELKEVGTITMLGFKKINGQWNLTLYVGNDC